MPTGRQPPAQSQQKADMHCCLYVLSSCLPQAQAQGKPCPVEVCSISLSLSNHLVGSSNITGLSRWALLIAAVLHRRHESNGTRWVAQTFVGVPRKLYELNTEIRELMVFLGGSLLRAVRAAWVFLATENTHDETHPS